jgi:hypothetical protein
MIYGYQNSNQVEEPVLSETWLDYLVETNPHGVMQVLARNGYTGYLAPQDESELADAASHFIARDGETAVVELLKIHPLYSVIADISREERSIPLNFLNADGVASSVMTTISTINYKKLIETLLILIGAFYIANKVFSYLSKD